jgi:hypothetical protein
VKLIFVIRLRTNAAELPESFPEARQLSSPCARSPLHESNARRQRCRVQPTSYVRTQRRAGRSSLQPRSLSAQGPRSPCESCNCAFSQCAASGFFLIVTHCPVETFIKAVAAGLNEIRQHGAEYWNRATSCARRRMSLASSRPIDSWPLPGKGYDAPAITNPDDAQPTARLRIRSVHRCTNARNSRENCHPVPLFETLCGPGMHHISIYKT